MTPSLMNTVLLWDNGKILQQNFAYLKVKPLSDIDVFIIDEASWFPNLNSWRIPKCWITNDEAVVFLIGILISFAVGKWVWYDLLSFDQTYRWSRFLTGTLLEFQTEIIYSEIILEVSWFSQGIPIQTLIGIPTFMNNIYILMVKRGARL